MKLRHVHERFYRRKRPVVLIIICDAKGADSLQRMEIPEEMKRPTRRGNANAGRRKCTDLL